MASFKLICARIKGCPPAKKVESLLEQYGLPERDEYGVLDFQAADEWVSARILRRSIQTYQQVDLKSKEVTAAQVEKVTVFPFAIFPKRELLEIYAGSAAAVKEIAAFLSGSLALATVVEQIEFDTHGAVEKLAQAAQKFQLRAARVSDYAANSYMIGSYAPKFADSEHGKDFMEQYAEVLTAVSVKFQAHHGRANVTLSPKAAFSYSCHEDDAKAVREILRKLV
jgi:hypothetical protein